MRLADAHETWFHAATVRGRSPRPCCFCGEEIFPGSPRAQRQTQFAHYACAPGLGSPVYAPEAWLTPLFGASSRIGGREENEDRERVVASPSGRVLRLAVADGMGGHAEGAQAAMAAVSVLDQRSPLVEVVRSAHAAAQQASRGGTTLCIAEVRRTASVRASGEGREVVFCQVGDSTASLVRLVRTKTGVGVEVVLQTEAQGVGRRLLQCVGISNAGPPEPMITRTKAGRGQLVFVYSDGVNAAMTPEVLPSLLDRFVDRASLVLEDLTGFADAVTEAAAAHGSTDNATLVVLPVP